MSTPPGALSGKRALVTGSYRGIGRGIATSLAQEGAQVILHGLGSDESKDVAEEALEKICGGNFESYTSDLRDSTETQRLIARILEQGPVDILVNNAGIQHTARIDQMPRNKWDEILAVNLSAIFDTMRLLLPGMAERGYGRVINIASVHGLVASVAKAPYVAAKHGVIGLTKVAALEYATAGDRERGGVTVNAIAPGWVETDLIEPQISARVAKHGGDRQAGVADLLSEKEPSHRLSTPEEIGSAVIFLALPSSHNITGISLPIDGGWTAQ